MRCNQTRPRHRNCFVVEFRSSQVRRICLYAVTHIADGDFQRVLVKMKPSQAQMVRMAEAGGRKRACVKCRKEFRIA